jgi:hypothetical protein
VKLARSPYLAKRYAGLEILADLCRPGATDSRSAELGELVSFLLEDLHQALLKPFLAILIHLLSLARLTALQIRKFWAVAVRQHPSTIDAYFASWTLFMDHFSGEHLQWLCEAILAENRFPDAAFHFLKTFVGRASAEQVDEVFDALYPLTAAGEMVDCSRELLLVTLCSFIRHDRETIGSLCNEAWEMICSSFNLDLAAEMLTQLVDAIDAERATILLQSIFAIANLPVAFSSVFMKLIRRLLLARGIPFEEEEFVALLTFARPLIQSEPEMVCNFFSGLMSLPNIIARELVNLLFDSLSREELQHPSILQLITSLFNSREHVDEDSIARLWALLQRTGNAALAELVVDVHRHRRQIDSFVRFAQSHLSNEGVLLALRRMIHLV